MPAQATLSNNADNRVITGGSGTNLNGEADFTYNGTNLDLGDNKYIRLGASNDFQIWHNGGTGNTNIKQVTGAMYFYTGGDLNMLLNDGTSVDLYYANSKKFETTSTGAKVSGGTVELQSHMVRVGNRTTAQINAGVSTATGSLTLDTSVNNLKVYVNNQWAIVKKQGNDGSSQSLAARSAKALLDDGFTTSGVYWLDMHGGYTAGNAKLHYCLMDSSYDGGGWTMLYSMNHGNNFASGSNLSLIHI